MTRYVRDVLSACALIALVCGVVIGCDRALDLLR